MYIDYQIRTPQARINAVRHAARKFGWKVHLTHERTCRRVDSLLASVRADRQALRDKARAAYNARPSDTRPTTFNPEGCLSTPDKHLWRKLLRVERDLKASNGKAGKLTFPHATVIDSTGHTIQDRVPFQAAERMFLSMNYRQWEARWDDLSLLTKFSRIKTYLAAVGLWYSLTWQHPARPDRPDDEGRYLLRLTTIMQSPVYLGTLETWLGRTPAFAPYLTLGEFRILMKRDPLQFGPYHIPALQSNVKTMDTFDFKYTLNPHTTEEEEAHARRLWVAGMTPCQARAAVRKARRKHVPTLGEMVAAAELQGIDSRFMPAQPAPIPG